jgi:hypothetical protein
MKKFSILLVCLSIAFYSCSKSDDSAPTTQDPNGNNPSAPNPYAGYDIYASGSQANISVLWKNGKIFYQSPTDYSIVRTGGFCVVGNDIYEGAYKKYRNTGNNENDRGGCILKNGAVLFEDTGANTQIYDLVVSGNDVYYLTSNFGLHSIDSGRPKIWKNGQILYDLHSIASTNNNGVVAFSLQVVNNNVYIGAEIGSKRGYIKNGIFIQIVPPNLYNTLGYFFRDVLYVTPTNDVYFLMTYDSLTGPYTNNIKVFKNGVALPNFQSTVNKSYASQLIVQGNDVYLLGADDQKNVIWKNGVRNYLPDDNATNAILTDKVYDFDIIDNKIFIAGKIKTPTAFPYPQVWELTSANTTIVAHEVEVLTANYGDDNYFINKLVVLKK